MSEERCSPYLPVKWSDWLKLLIIVGMVISVVYNYHSYSITPDTHSHRYQTMGKAFLSGHTYVTPYIFWDVEHYRGKYYLYFGPVPVLLIWIPIKLLTGIELEDAEITWIMASAGTCSLFLLIYLMGLRQPFASLPGLLICYLAIGFSQWMPPVLVGNLYQAAIVSAYAFDAMGVLCVWMYLNNKESYFWQASASLCFGLAAGSRITHIFSIVILVMAFFHISWGKKLWRKEKWLSPTFLLNILYVFGPFMLCLAGLGLYNYERFGSIFDFGMRYQIGLYPYSNPRFQFFRLNSDLIRLHAYYYLFAPIAYGNWLAYCGDPQIPFGLLSNNLFAWFFFWIVDWRSFKSLVPEIKLIAYGMAVFALLQLAIICSYFIASGRYEGDFAPWIIFVAAINYLHILQRLLQRYRDTYYYWLLIAFSATLVAFECLLV